jgi:hypothetical protein
MVPLKAFSRTLVSTSKPEEEMNHDYSEFYIFISGPLWLMTHLPRPGYTTTVQAGIHHGHSALFELSE